MKEGCLTVLGSFIYAACYAVPYFVTVKKVADLLTDRSGQYVNGLDVTVSAFWYILGGVFGGLLIAAALVYCIVRQFGESAQGKIRLPVFLYWIFSVLPSIILLVLTYKVYGKSVPCGVNSTMACPSSGDAHLAPTKFEGFDAYSVMIVHVTLAVLIGCEWFAKLKENDYDMKYIFFVECGSEFLPIFDMAEMWNMLMLKDLFTSDILVIAIATFGVTSMLRFVPTPPRVDESGELRPKRGHILLYLFGHELPFFVLRVIVVVFISSTSADPQWNQFIFIFKSGVFSIWYTLLLCLLDRNGSTAS